MTIDIQVGDRVKLLGVPDWLMHDLPESEKVEMRAFIGQSAVVREIDSHGYFWLGFGVFEELGDTACYSGHSFCVSRDFIETL
jgi:hypothetical protein